MSAKTKAAKVTAGDVQLEVPAGYAVKMMMLTTAPEAPEPDGLPFARNVVVSREAVAAGTRASELCQRQLHQCAHGMERYSHVGTSEVVIDGETCPLAEIRGSGPGGLTYGSLMAFYVSGTDGFVVSASNREGAPFERTRAELLAVLESFRIKKETS